MPRVAVALARTNKRQQRDRTKQLQRPIRPGRRRRSRDRRPPLDVRPSRNRRGSRGMPRSPRRLRLAPLGDRRPPPPPPAQNPRGWSVVSPEPPGCRVPPAGRYPRRRLSAAGGGRGRGGKPGERKGRGRGRLGCLGLPPLRGSPGVPRLARRLAPRSLRSDIGGPAPARPPGPLRGYRRSGRSGVPAPKPGVGLAPGPSLAAGSEQPATGALRRLRAPLSECPGGSGASRAAPAPSPSTTPGTLHPRPPPAAPGHSRPAAPERAAGHSRPAPAPRRGSPLRGGHAAPRGDRPSRPPAQSGGGALGAGAGEAGPPSPAPLHPPEAPGPSPFAVCTATPWSTPRVTLA